MFNVERLILWWFCALCTTILIDELFPRMTSILMSVLNLFIEPTLHHCIQILLLFYFILREDVCYNYPIFIEQCACVFTVHSFRMREFRAFGIRFAAMLDRAFTIELTHLK